MREGDSLGPYCILGKLGKGGMGEVYRARDVRLDRPVAIKVLLEAFAADPDRLLRFEHEARAASALNHPNILTVYDIGTHGGAPYLVTELLEGQPLKEKLSGRPLPAADVVEAGRQLADALDAAHARGIVHRDVKPANIFVTARGPFKLLDFGLAKTVGARPSAPDAPTVGGEWVTGAGVTLGTVGYMSPEQARGEAVDARTDLFSLGVVLYEMATGTAPFRGPTSAAVLGEILTKAPAPMARLSPGVPAELERVIAKALEKDRDVRYQSARDLLVDLTRLKRDLEHGPAPVPGAAPPAGIPSLAVLPFANLSGDKDNEYFSDGLAEDIIDALAQVPGLRVMARTSAFAFRGREVDVRRIGAELNVGHILEGSVRRAGGRIRVTVQLVSASDGFHLWSQRFDRELTDVFAIQDEVSQAIVEKLRGRLSADRPPVKRYTENLAAYDLCLKARYHLLTMTPEGRDAGRRYCEQAIALDPGYALAHVMLAESCFWNAFWGTVEPRAAFSTAKAAALEALRLDDAIADAHSALGTVLGCGEFDWEGAEREFTRAAELNPSSGPVRYAYAWCYAMWFLLPLGRVEPALAEMRRALQLDPLDPFYNALLAYLLHASGRPDEAVAQFQRAVDLDPGFNFSHMLFAITLNAMDRHADAVQVAERANELSGGSVATRWVLGGAYCHAGRTAEARQILADLTERRRSAYVPASAFVFLHGGLQESDASLEWLARAVEERDPIVVTSLTTARAYEGLRPLPAYQALLREMHLEPREART